MNIELSNSTGGGGGIYILNIQSILIENSIFTKNKATEGKGGAILFECDIEADYECENNIQQNIFRNNEAEEGGAMASTITPFTTLLDNTFEDNISLFGGYIFKPLHKIEVSYPLSACNNLYDINECLGIINITMNSGQSFKLSDDTKELLLYLKDEDGNMIERDSSSSLIIQSNDTSAILAEYLITAINGLLDLNNFILTYPPHNSLGKSNLPQQYIYIYIYTLPPPLKLG